jgi:hypothetical protein
MVTPIAAPAMTPLDPPLCLLTGVVEGSTNTGPEFVEGAAVFCGSEMVGAWTGATAAPLIGIDVGLSWGRAVEENVVSANGVTLMGAWVDGADVGAKVLGAKVVGDLETGAFVTLQLGDEQSPKMTKETVKSVPFAW